MLLTFSWKPEECALAMEAQWLSTAKGIGKGRTCPRLCTVILCVTKWKGSRVDRGAWHINCAKYFKCEREGGGKDEKGFKIRGLSFES